MPMSAREVRQALHELGDLRYAVGDLDDALRRIVHATHKLFAVDGAGLMLIDPDQLLRNVAEDEQLGDTTTLADPSVVEGIKDRYLTSQGAGDEE